MAAAPFNRWLFAPGYSVDGMWFCSQSDVAGWGSSYREGTLKKIIAFAFVAGVMLTAEKSAPHDTGLNIPSAQSQEILVACIEKKMGGNIVAERPIKDGGLSIQTIKYPSSPFFGHPTLYFDITQADGNRLIGIHYRHPMSKGAAAKWTRIVGRKCFPYELEAAGGGKLPEGDD